MERGAWQAIVHGVTKSRTVLSNLHTHIYIFDLLPLISMSRGYIQICMYLSIINCFAFKYKIKYLKN